MPRHEPHIDLRDRILEDNTSLPHEDAPPSEPAYRPLASSPANSPFPTIVMNPPQERPLVNFEPLAEIHLDEFIQPPVRKRAEEINARIRQLEDNRARFLDTMKSIANTPVEKIDFDNSIGLPVPKLSFAALLQEELAVRSLLSEIEPDLSQGIMEAAEAVYQKIEPARQKLRAALVKLGWRDTEPTTIDPGKIQPGWIECHPQIAALRAEHQSLQARAGLHDMENQNIESADRVRQQLERLKERSLAVA
jgi:hypothetical protein